MFLPLSIFLGILLTLVILTIVVFIHEMGHFLTARLTGMRVEEFGIGIPPRAKGLYRDKKGTEYTLNWLPIGGFVRIHGEDPTDTMSDPEVSFSRKKWWARALVLVAGVSMNFLLAWMIFSGLFYLGTSPIAPNTLVSKSYGSQLLPSFDESLASGYVRYTGISIYPIEGGPASQAGVASGAEIIALDGQRVVSLDTFMKHIQRGEGVFLTIKDTQTGEITDKTITPINGKISAYLKYNNLTKSTDYTIELSLIDALVSGGRETYALSHMTLDVLAKTVRDLVVPKSQEAHNEAKEMVAGPIGMGAGMVRFVEYGIDFHLFLSIIALLSVNLGVLNILPLPALDGGRLVSTSIFSFIGLFTDKKDLMIRAGKWIHGSGMILLILLSIYIAFLDILKL